MITEVITTGTELLLGEIANKNAQWLASLLNAKGFTVAYMTVVGDNPSRMREVFETALKRADLVITSGGLGSTLGDITKRAGAEVIGVPYIRIPEESDRLLRYYKDKGRELTPALDRQSWFASGAHIFQNNEGSANGSASLKNGKILIHLPGPPFEMKSMMENHVLPWLDKIVGKQGTIQSLVLSVKDGTEAAVEEKIHDLLVTQSNPTIALLARPGYIAVRITAKGRDCKEAADLIESVAHEIEDRIPNADRYNLENQVIPDLYEFFLKNKLTISAAESCTGGLIGKLLTDLPGSSAFFKGSAVTYWDEAKEKVLSVSGKSLAEYTAVSEPVARQMVEGSRNLYGSDIAVSTTGYAGPGKGERGENAGLVYIGVSGPSGTKVYKEQFLGSRESVRYGAAERALYYAFKYAENIKKG